MNQVHSPKDQMILPISVRPVDEKRHEFVVTFSRPMGVTEMNHFHGWLIGQMLGYAPPENNND